MNQSRSDCARALLAGGAVFACLTLAPQDSQAQAWLPSKGSMSVSLDHTDMLNKKHYFSDGREVDVGHTDLEITSISGSYSPSDRVLIDASLSYVKSRYRGAGGGGHDTEIDNGSWHGSVTDLQLSAHFQVTDGPIAFAPYIGVVYPTNTYTTFGHSAPGRGLEELWLGFYAARSLHEWIPRTYVQFRGNYAFVEQIAGVSHDRTNATFEVGYFFNQDWNARLIVSEQWTHGGVHIPIPVTDPLFLYHDRLAEEENVTVGAGVSWNLNDRVNFYGLYMQHVDGRNTHKVDHRVSVGMSYGIGDH